MRQIFSGILMMLAGAAAAQDGMAEITVTTPFAYETSAMAQAGAGYMDITNTGDEGDVLLSAEADFPRVMLHNTVMDGDVAKMEHLMNVPIPAGETVSFAPGGMHVMFMGLGNDTLEAGETIPATLVFENAGRVDVVFEVKARSNDTDDAHAGH